MRFVPMSLADTKDVRWHEMCCEGYNLSPSGVWLHVVKIFSPYSDILTPLVVHSSSEKTKGDGWIEPVWP